MQVPKSIPSRKIIITKHRVPDPSEDRRYFSWLKSSTQIKILTKEKFSKSTQDSYVGPTSPTSKKVELSKSAIGKDGTSSFNPSHTIKGNVQISTLAPSLLNFSITSHCIFDFQNKGNSHVPFQMLMHGEICPHGNSDSGEIRLRSTM